MQEKNENTKHMKIGIDASRAFIGQRTGIEEYAYQLIKHLADKLDHHQVILYVNQKAHGNYRKVLGELRVPEKWIIKEIPMRNFWTQIGLAWEMAVDPVDVLFVPAHTVPWLHPANTIVTVHGLEYEHCPESYPFLSRIYHRFFVKRSCAWASRIIAVSENTKKDLQKMYGVPADKITVVYNGYDDAPGRDIVRNHSDNDNGEDIAGEDIIQNTKYILYIGRLETRKNIEGIVKAFEILKQEYHYSGRLVLAGKPGHGYEAIRQVISGLASKYDIMEIGFVSPEKKWRLISNADLFLFPSLCEGFGIPILEAQSCGVPVITSNYGPMDEVAGNPAVLADPKDPRQIAAAADRIFKDERIRHDIVGKGLINIKRFSWEKSAQEIKDLLISQ